MDSIFVFIAGTCFGGFTTLFVGNLLFNFFNTLEEIQREPQQ